MITDSMITTTISAKNRAVAAFSELRIPSKARIVMNTQGTSPIQIHGISIPNSCWKVTCRYEPISPTSAGPSSAYATNMSPPVVKPARGPSARVIYVEKEPELGATRAISMTPLATMSVTTSVARETNGVAYPENGGENCGLKKVETAGPIMAADMITVPPKPTEFRRSPGTELFTTSDEVSVFDMSYAALLRVRPRWDRGIIRQTLDVCQW